MTNPQAGAQPAAEPEQNPSLLDEAAAHYREHPQGRDPQLVSPPLTQHDIPQP